MSAKDWEELLAAQSVSRKKIADAKRAARRMTEALEGVDFSPEDPLAPEEFPLILTSRLREQKTP
ncbi:MAG: hypothetical protein QNJ67_03380 [Kiloniellales bacterium]|nr:hypothetical protein [Kiloniellales bacterium]